MPPIPDLPGLRLASCPAEEASTALAAGELGDLSPAERAVLGSWPTEKRRRDWLAGRLAAKRALRRHLAQDRGLDLREADIEVLNDASGRPYCRLPGDGAGRPAPSFSISHSAPGGLCAVSRAGAPVGVDWEAVEERPAEVFALYAGDDERGAWGGSAVERTRLWALKEAVLKGLGLGLAADPKELRIPRRESGGAWRARLSGGALSRWESLGRPGLALESWDEPGAVVAVSHGG